MRTYAYIHTHARLYVPVYTGIGSMCLYYLKEVEDSVEREKKWKKKCLLDYQLEASYTSR